MSAIEGSSAGVKDLVDGSLRITIEFTPDNAKEAYSLFGSRGTPVAVVAFKDGYVTESEDTKEIKKGGELSKLAARFCNNLEFFNFIWPVYDRIIGGTGIGFGDLDNHENMNMSDFSRHAICVICGINSRAELDHNKEAAAIFHDLIRKPYSEWLNL